MSAPSRRTTGGAPPRAIIFDFDGTLFDSAPDIAFCANEVRRLEQLAPLLDTTIRDYIGDGSERLLHRCLTDSFDGVADDRMYQRARDHFQSLYLENLSARSAWFPHALELITRLNECQIPVGLATNKPTRFTLPLIDELACHDLFSAIVCGDTLDTKKPAPEPLLHISSNVAVAPRECVMVGDSQIDMEAATAAGMEAVFIRHGYCRDRKRAEELAVHSIESLDELNAVIGL